MTSMPAVAPGPLLGLHRGRASHWLLPSVTDYGGGMKADSPTSSGPLPFSCDTGISPHKILEHLIPSWLLLFGGSGLTQLAIPSCKTTKDLKGSR